MTWILTFKVVHGYDIDMSGSGMRFQRLNAVAGVFWCTIIGMLRTGLFCPCVDSKEDMSWFHCTTAAWAPMYRPWAQR